MNKSYLIDGYNVIHASRDLARMLASFGMERARIDLINHLASFAERRSCQVTVVFDGVAPDQGTGRVRVLSSRSRSADEVIREQIRLNGRSLTVVSSDLEIIGTARSNMATTISSAQFALELTTSNRYESSAGARPKRIDEHRERSEKPGALGQDDIDEWKKLFGE